MGEQMVVRLAMNTEGKLLGFAIVEDRAHYLSQDMIARLREYLQQWQDMGDSPERRMTLLVSDARRRFEFVTVEQLLAETEATRLRPLEEWHEDYGNALWWALPICEPPYAGSPLDTEWPGYHTHWTRIIVPAWEVSGG